MPRYTDSAREVVDRYLSGGKTPFAEFDFDDDFPVDRPVEVAAIAGVRTELLLILNANLYCVPPVSSSSTTTRCSEKKSKS